jgi:ATP-dependent helicase/nuclease subunit B
MMDTAATDAPLIVYPDATDLLAEAARRIIARHVATLPDLTAVAILLPHSAQAPRLARLLLDEARQHGHQALLGPEITTLDHWLQDHYPLDRPVMDASAALLWLIGALRHHPDLYGEGSALGLAESLLSLFEELARQEIALPVEEAACRSLLARAYGLGNGAHALQSREAKLIHTLWRAWQEELDARGAHDEALARRARLAAASRAPAQFLHLIAPDEHDRGTAHIIANWCRAQRAEVLLSASTNPYSTDTTALRKALPDSACACIETAPDAYRDCLTAVYAQGTALAARARACASLHPDSPLKGRIAIHSAQGLEEAARGVDIQVRRWLLGNPLPGPPSTKLRTGLPQRAGEGDRAGNVKTIAIVSEDRKLARRIRALLERGGIAIEDGAGWALSTTRAASTVEHWLICVEEDFPQRTLLDLLQSPFFRAPAQRGDHLETTAHFERDIIRHESIARGLARYRRALRRRRDALPEGWSPQRFNNAVELLDHLDEAARPLLPLRKGQHLLPRYLRALQGSLDTLAIWPQLCADPAGQRITALIETLATTTPDSDTVLTWEEFRALFGRLLECENFIPPARGPVQLLNLAQAAHGRYDALIIAGAEHEHLPGPAPETPFFNEAVRREIGLAGARERLTLCFGAFRSLLEAAPQILISARTEEDGEAITPSPWLAALQSFHHLAWGDDLSDPLLAALARDARTQVTHGADTALPTLTERPRPAQAGALLPQAISVGVHQQLVDCPYRFFAATLLRLKVPDEVREALEKRDYGQRVHRCLEAFHGGIEDLPGPWRGTLDAAQHGAAIALLETISRQVFARDIEDNFEHRGWLARWLALIPDYVDWQIAHPAEVIAVELDATCELPCGITLRGRLDRVQRDDSGITILDYKTGETPKQALVNDAEAVQLTSYALLRPDAAGIEYLGLNVSRDEKIRVKSKLAGTELATLRDAVGVRLDELLTRIRAGAALPAWGDAETCDHCEFDAVCRRAAWV